MKHWINNGEVERQIDDGCMVPDGFVLGRRKLSKEQQEAKNEKWLAAMRKKSNEEIAVINKKRSDSCKASFSRQSEDEKAEVIRKRQRMYYNHDGEWYDQHRLNISLSTKGKNSGKVPWNKGLSKENDNRLAKQAQSCREGVLKFVETKRQQDPNYYQRWRESINDKMIQEGTFNSSSQEETYYLQLVESFGKGDVVRQYSDARYPYKCDFYIPSQDLFIELNAHWTHGGRPFVSSNKECQMQLKDRQQRAKYSQYYENAIYTWTDLDVRKREIALQNSLNYKVIY